MENKLYLGDAWYKDMPESDEEKRTGLISELRLMQFLFSDCILANTLAEECVYQGDADPIIDAYDEETEEYTEVYQWFIVNLALSEERTAEILEAAGGLYLYYSEKYDLYILGISDFGTSRDYVMTNIRRATNYEESNLL